jgi:hypothetical protein
VPNPCVFTMPNDSVSISADFAQYQTLFTSYTGYGQLSPACPTGCQAAVGSSVSIVATPAPGWVVSGYSLTSGISCSSQPGYICSFTMPNFPVTFVVAFAEGTISTQSTITVSSTIQTSVTSTTLVGNKITSTTTTSTLSVTETGGTQTATLYSTTSVTATQTESNLATQFWTLSSSETSVTTTLADPSLEFTVGAIILFSVVAIGISAIRRGHRGGLIVCTRCGFKNSSGTKFCVGCGESLKRL